MKIIFFSDPDEIPDPKLLINFELKKKYGIFFKNVLILNLIFLILTKLLGREREFVNPKI